MPGVPTSRACNACRKQKKKCDEAKPSCSHCTRLAIPCVGGGLQRFIFKSYSPERLHEQLMGTPRTGPSNATTMITSALTSILEIHDDRYDIRYCGPHLMSELPRRIGSDKALDTSISALIAIYKAVVLRIPNQNALIHYGNALKAVRTSLHDPKRSVVSKMRFVVIMFACSQWIDRKHSNKHRSAMAYLFTEIMAQGRISEFDPGDVSVWCAHAIFESVVNPNLILGSWYREMSLQRTVMIKTYTYGTCNVISRELWMVGELAALIRDPKRHLRQLKCYHDALATEGLMMRGQVEKLMPMSRQPEERRSARRFLTVYAGILSQVILVTSVLESLGERPAHAEKSDIMCDEVIALAKTCNVFRPIGTFWMPEMLKLAWASFRDCHRHREIEEFIMEYEKDADESDFMAEAKDVQARFDQLRRRSRAPEVSLPEDRVDDAPLCIIL